MNTFVNAATNHATTTRTENGDLTYSTSLNACVDLFFQMGALRAADSRRIENVFSAAYGENPDLATRIALYARDIRQGAGERKFFRIVIKYLEAYDPDRLLRILPLIPALGRWDDLLVVLDNDRVARAALGLYAVALRAGDGLAAKWAPREKQNRKLASRLASFLGLEWPAYRKLLAGASKTVEQAMCAKDWGSINYSHVPSVASARYAKAFGRNDNARYVAYLEAVRNNKVDPSTGKVAKINTGAVYPYDVLKAGVNDVTADTMWNNLPDFVPQGASFMPVVDVSGSMSSPAGGNISCLDVSTSLGMYLAERNKSAFKNLILTFNSSPWFFQIPEGTLRQRHRALMQSDRAMHGSTDLDKAMQLIVDLAVQNRVPAEEVPSTLVVLSDMEFNGASSYGGGTKTVAQRTRERFENAGYKVPNIVWWNIQSRHGSTPVRHNEHGMALVSGFSPSIMTNLLGGEMTPEKIVIKAVSSERYDH